MIARCLPPAAAALLAPAAVLLASAAGPATFEIALWADNPAARRAPHVVRLDPHPCGTIAIVRLAAMPPYREHARGLGTELIAEAGTDPRRAMRWSVPVDYQPLAISGREILIDHYDRHLWIGDNSGIRRETGRRTYPPIVPMSCPTGGAHAGSEYALCAGLTDLRSGRQRNIQYEAICT
jgi:hypothetical protein